MKMYHLMSATALAGTLLVAGPAFAQVPATPGPTDTPEQVAKSQTAQTKSAEEEQAAQDEEILVVGSRIRRDTFNTPDPIQVITRSEATAAGFNSTAELLQSTSVTGGTSQINNSFGGFVTNGGPGANTLSLRGLGATRTLLLLNGRRVAPAGSRGSVGSADLNVLPNAMLERVEILNSGASSVYGSDAIAGVVNLVTRTKIKGVELEGQHNITEAGAGNTRRYSAVFGTYGDNFSLSGSLEYFKRDRLAFGDRAFTACQISLRKTNFAAAPGSASYIDPRTGQPKCYGETGVTGASGVTINTIGTPDRSALLTTLAPGTPTGYTGACNRFRPSATATGIYPGYECVGGGAINIGVRDLFPQSQLNSDLVSPAEVYTGFLQGSYKLDALGGAEVYSELLLNRRKSSQLGNRQLTIDYPLGSPLIPAIFQSTTAFLPAQAGGVTGTTPIGVRLFTDYGNYDNRQTVDFAKITAGLRGTLFGDFRYDAYFSKAWSDADYTTDLVLTSKLAQSLDVVASGTGFACRNTLGGCVAAPAITPAVIGGQFPAAWIDFITDPVTGTTKFRETVYNVTFDGPLFRLPGGNVQIAIGGEYRKSTIDDTPGIDSQNNNLFGFTSSSITRGKDSVKEVFGEIEVPLLADMPFIHRLSFNASGRYTDYQSYGSNETYKVGGQFAPTDFLSFRGSYGTSFRAPALFEQFLGATTGFQSQNNDPCNNYQNSTNENVRANCAAVGIPTGYTATSSITVQQLGGAATGLSAETSRNYTFGGILQPKLGDFGTFSLAVDYFNVLVKNGVSQLGFATILNQCYSSAPSDFTARADTCALITRTAASPYTLTVVQGYVNISNAKVSGIDFTARYSVPIGPGTFRLGALVTMFDKRYNQTLPTDPIRNQVHAVNNPKWTGSFDGGYTYKNVTARYGVEWLQHTYTNAYQLATTQAIRDTYYLQTPDYFLHNASVQWQLDKFGFLFGVRNLTNAKLPEISSGVYNRVGNVPLYSGYDYVGRTFFVNVTTKF